MKVEKKRKNRNSLIYPALAFIIVGVFLFIDAVGLSPIGFRHMWISLLVLLVGLALIVGMAIRRDTFLLFSATCITGIGSMLFLLSWEALNLTFANLWPILFVAPSLGILLVYILKTRKKLYFQIGLMGLIISVSALIGALFNLWLYFAPIVLVLIGIALIISNIILDNIKAKDDYEIKAVSIQERIEIMQNTKRGEALAKRLTHNDGLDKENE